MTRPDFTRCLAVLLAAFPKLAPDQATVEVWYRLLQDLTAQQLEPAVLAFCRAQREIYPGTNVVASLRDLALPNPHPTAYEAWAELQAKIFDPYDRNTMMLTKQLSPLVREAVDQLGLSTLVRADRGFIRADFLKCYEALRSGARQAQVVAEQPQIEHGRVKALIASAIPGAKVALARQDAPKTDAPAKNKELVET